MKHFLGNFCNLLSQLFFNFQSEVVGCFVKIMRNDQRPNIVSTPSIYKTPWEEKETRNFWPVINSLQWSILYSYQNDEVLNEWELLRWKQKPWSFSISNWSKYKKWIVSAQDSHTQHLRWTSQHWWKVKKVIFSGVFSSTTESYMIITNILKIINLEEQ